MRGARVRAKLAAGGAVLNVMVPFHSPAVIEMLGLAGVERQAVVQLEGGSRA